MRYGKNQPAARSLNQQPLPLAGKNPRDGAAWREVVLAHRATFEARWAELAPVGAWWNELNAFDRIGDLTPAAADAEVVAFTPFRATSQTGCAMATLLAINGRGDEAIDTLLPILQVGRKLQPSARTLVRLMIGIVIERLAVETGTFVLEATSVSPAARARLAAALQAATPRPGHAA